MRATLVMAMALALSGHAAMAQERAEEDDFIVINDTRATEDCTPDTAHRMSFAAAPGAPESERHCLTVDGLWVGNRFYDGIDGYYRAEAAGSEPVTSRLGVYGWWARVEPPDTPAPARLTGRVGDCRDLGSAPNVIMVSGYCHYVSGGYIALGSAEITGPTPYRLLGAQARAGIGQLLEPPLDWAHRTYVEGRVWTWLERLRSNDITAYAEAMGLGSYAADPDEPGSDIQALFREPGSVFDRLRNERVDTLRIWLFAPRERDVDEPPVDPTDLDAVACFRLGEWTDDRWPVAGVDADNAPERPYACVAVGRETYDGEIEEYLDVPHSRRSLAEPAT